MTDLVGDGVGDRVGDLFAGEGIRDPVRLVTSLVIDGTLVTV